MVFGSNWTQVGPKFLSKRLVVSGLPLAKIGNALRTKAMAWHAVEAGRFRFGGEKEAAGVCRGRGDLALPYGD
jgi:hypothetical protein